MKLVDRICKVCSKKYKVDYRFIKYDAIRHNKPEDEIRTLCGKECSLKYRSESKREDVNCAHCSKTISVLKRQLNKSKSKLIFCGHSCSASYSNKQRKLHGYTTKNKITYRYCEQCKLEDRPFSIHTIKTICLDCHPKELRRVRERLNAKQKFLTCQKCKNKPPASKAAKYCEPCLKEIQSKTGRSNAAKRQKRSKSEIYLEELCKKDNLNIKCNSQLFNGWDCDIALMDYKIAILWNGPWHYQECGGKHSLLQTQSRDKIKLKEIIKAGWQPYIVEDRKGKFKESFVQDNFNNIKLFIKDIKINKDLFL